MTSSLRERRKQQLREEILDTAQSLMAEKGYTTMSMDELAAQVGISKPTLYSYFATKDELVVAAIMRKMQRLIEVMEAGPGDRSPLDHLLLLLRTITQRQIDEGTMTLRPWTPELFQLLCAHEEALSYLRRLDAAVVSLIKDGIASGEIDQSLDPATIVRSFYALVGSLNFAPFSAGGAPNPAAAVDTLVAIFERGVRTQR